LIEVPIHSQRNGRYLEHGRIMRFAPRKAGSARVASRLGWVAIGALAVSATARALFRSGRPETAEPTDATPDGQPPDVLLDVEELRVDKISLEVEALRAHVAVLAALANLVNVSIGVDATLRGVKLEIEGVEAKVILKARLKNVRAILDHALDTVAEHPEILRILGRSLDRVTRETLGEALDGLSGVLEGLQVGDTVDDALKGKLEELRATLEEILGSPEVESGGDMAQWALGGG
jgi:hypothetical protein